MGYTKGKPREITEDMVVGYDVYGREIEAGRLSKWAYRQLETQPEMYEALKEISEGRGRYSRDELTHASNTIEDMKALAVQALLKAEGK